MSDVLLWPAVIVICSSLARCYFNLYSRPFPILVMWGFWLFESQKNESPVHKSNRLTTMLLKAEHRPMRIQIGWESWYYPKLALVLRCKGKHRYCLHLKSTELLFHHWPCAWETVVGPSVEENNSNLFTRLCILVREWVLGMGYGGVPIPVVTWQQWLVYSSHAAGKI